MFALKIVLLALSIVASTQQDLPVRLPPVPGSRLGENTGTCPLPQNLDQVENDIRSSLDQTVIPELNNRPVCPCGGAGEWRRIAHLNMSDPNQQQCPTNWRLISTPVRACGAASGASCSSAVFPSTQTSYSRVCGRVIGYQDGKPDAFHTSTLTNGSLESLYLDGVSLTHGPPGLRQHIWSFASAALEIYPNFNISNQWSVCPCTNTNYTWPHQVPSFVGNNYFCDTGNRGPGSSTSVYADDPLWDGEGCGPTSTCCEFNTPPWFCTTLPQPTTDDIELRICQNNNLSEEATLISSADIYIM